MRFDRWFQIQRLQQFNAKFFPRWVPRYAMVEGWLSAPRAGLAIMDLEGQLPAACRSATAPDAPGERGRHHRDRHRLRSTATCGAQGAGQRHEARHDDAVGDLEDPDVRRWAASGRPARKRWKARPLHAAVPHERVRLGDVDGPGREDRRRPALGRDTGTWKWPNTTQSTSVNRAASVRAKPAITGRPHAMPARTAAVSGDPSAQRRG